MLIQIVDDPGSFFLARPRRFGKSTLLSTLHELFANGLTRFKDLKFEKAYEDFHMHPWPNKTYKVIHLDFSVFKNVCNTTVERFTQIFKNKLIDAMESVDIPISDTTYDYPPAFFFC